MAYCTGFALAIGQGNVLDIGDWVFASQGENFKHTMQFGTFPCLFVERKEEGSTESLILEHEAISLCLLGDIYNRDALWTLVHDLVEKTNVRDDRYLLFYLIKRYGTVAMRLINGRYAAVLFWKNQIVLVTDHAGSVPLYYSLQNGILYVATELKTLVRANGLSFPLRDFEDRIYEADPSETIFRDIKRVTNGTVVQVQFNPDQIIRSPYWAIPSDKLVNSESQTCEAIYQTLEQALTFRRQSEGEIGVILSGGIDSSAITSLLALSGCPLHTFCIGTTNTNEFEFANLVVERYHLQHHELLVEEEDMVHSLPFVVWGAEVPQAQFIEYLLPVYLAYRWISSFTRYVITGYGSDILFGGMIPPGQNAEAVEQEILRDVLSTDGSNEFTHVIGLMHGIWTTHPFWDREFLRLALQIDPFLKNKKGIEKYILRKSFEHVLPPRNVWRPKLGIHQSTGAQNILNNQIQKQKKGDLDLLKTKLIYALIRAMYVEGVPPQHINLEKTIDGL